MRPTDSELSILRVLWSAGPSTVRQIYSHLNSRKATGYTTVLKLLQIMTVKGLVTRDTSDRSHIYRAKLGEAQTQKHLLSDLLAKAFGGSTQKLLMQALDVTQVSQSELAEIQKLLKQESKP